MTKNKNDSTNHLCVEELNVVNVHNLGNLKSARMSSNGSDVVHKAKDVGIINKQSYMHEK